MSSAAAAEQGRRAWERPPSLKRRYAIKLLASIAAIVAGFGVETLAPRALGPASYGNYYFIQQFFTQLLALVGGGMSLAFTTRLARRPRATGFVGYYFAWLIFIPVLVQIFVLAVDRLGLGGILWPGIHFTYVEIAALAVYFVFLAREATGLGDALGLTVPFETIRIVQRMLALMLLISLFWMGAIDLRNLLFYLGATNAVLVIALVIELRATGHGAWPRRLPHRSEARAISVYFYRYSAPVVMYSVVSTVAGIFDRWLLEVSAGSIQQGYFSLGFQVSSMLALFTTALSPLLMREMSIAHGTRDKDVMARLFVTSLNGLYFCAAFFSCFVACQADRIAVVMGGAAFAPSALSLGLLVLSPLHQAYGIVSASVYYSTGETRLFRNLAVALLLCGLCMTWILVGPRDWFGLGLGSTGLALKVTLFQVIAANVLVYVNCRQLGVGYRRLVGHQLLTPGLLLAIAVVARLATSGLAIGGRTPPQNILWLTLSGMIYVSCASIMVAAIPTVAGLTRHQLGQFTGSLRRYVASLLAT